MPLTLADFKRPPQDNGRGAHGSANSGWTGGSQGLDYWIAELQALGVKWFHLLDDGGDSLPVCARLVAAGIFPVVRILRRDPPPNDAREPNPGHLNAREEQLVKKMLDAGVMYLETNNEPNRGAEWKNGAIPSDPLEAAKLVALNWLFDARFILEAGGYPALPAVSSGDNMDLMGALAALGRQDILLEGCWIAIHNYGLNRPLNYPVDAVNQNGAPLSPQDYDLGPLTAWAWWNREQNGSDSADIINRLRVEGKNTGQTIMQDHSCFREFEYYDALALKYVGRSIPILSTEGGFLVGRRQDRRYPRVTPALHADSTVAMFDFMQREAPDYYFATLPWLMLPSAGREADAWYSDFWQRAFGVGPRPNGAFPPFPVPDVQVGESLPVVAALKAMPNLSRLAPAAPAPEARPIAAAPPPPPPPGEQNMYIVQHGDALPAIASKFGTTVAAILTANKIGDAGQVLPGQRLAIPVPAVVPPPPRPPVEQPTASAPRPPLPPRPPAPRSSQGLDPRLSALHVRVLHALVPPGQQYWRLVQAEYLDPYQSGGSHHIIYVLQDENGAPVVGQSVAQGLWNDQVQARTDPYGQAMIALWASYAPDHNESGPYSAWVDDLPSDRVTGLGLPLNRQASFRLTWQRTIKQQT